MGRGRKGRGGGEGRREYLVQKTQASVGESGPKKDSETEGEDLSGARRLSTGLVKNVWDGLNSPGPIILT